jgi:hypothetical protein
MRYRFSFTMIRSVMRRLLLGICTLAAWNAAVATRRRTQRQSVGLPVSPHSLKPWITIRGPASDPPAIMQGRITTRTVEIENCS